MVLSTLIGWMLVAGAIAAAIRKESPAPPGGEGRASPAGASVEAPSDSEETGRRWCRVIEEILDAEAFLFDDGLCLLAQGERARLGFPPGRHPQHLIDIAPQEDAPLFLAGAAAARRGEGSSWECRWKGRRATVQALAVPPERILIVVRIREGAP